MKRFISLIVALAMLLSVCGSVALAEGQTGYSDVDGTGYETPVSILGALNIMGGYTDGNFHPYATVTRAEMATISVRLLGITNYGDKVSLDELQYLDMDGHPYAAAVAYARSLGIVDGYVGGYFYPDDPVTYEQAVKMIVGALGYDYYATASGGYPNGYLSVARDLKLTSGIGLTVGAYITRGDVAKIVHRALTVDLMEPTKYGNGREVTYEIVSGKNVLNTYFDVEKLHGVVEENSHTALDGESSLEDGEVKIGDEIFDDGGTNIGDYLGYYVSFYALSSEDTDKRIIISYNVESSKNDYIKINAENIENVKINSSGYVIEYWRNLSDRNTRQIRVSATPLVIYNGVALTDFTLNDLNPDYGQLTLLDTDRNGEYDLIDVVAYDVFLVLNSSASNGNVTAHPSFTTGLRYTKLLADDENYTAKIVDGDGNLVSMNSINVNSVLHVAISKDEGNTVRTAIVSNNSVTGTIKSITSTGKYVIEGKEYDVINYIDGGKDLAIGDSGTFYLTYDGRIAGYESEQRISRNIGMYIACNKGKMSEGGNVIKIMKSDGSFGIYNLAASVKVNNVTYSGSELFEMIADEDNPLFGKREPESGLSGKTVPEPSLAGILYKVNKSGDISEIIMNTKDTVPEATSDDGYSNNEIRCVVQRGKNSGFQYWTNPVSFSGSRKVAGNAANAGENTGDSLYYSKNYHSFHRGGKQVFTTDNMVIMYSQDSWQKTSDNQVYWVETPAGYWENQYFEWYETYFYFVGDSKYADFAVFYDGYDAKASENSSSSKVDRSFQSNWYLWYSGNNPNVKIVDRMVEKYPVNNDGVNELVYSLYYWDTGAYVEDVEFDMDRANIWYRDGRSTFWRRGDMVRMIMDGGKISNIGSIFSDYAGNNGNVSWNDPTGVELTGGRNGDHRYKFPNGVWELDRWSSNDRMFYYIGRVSSIDTLRYFSTMNIQYGENQILSDEPIEGNCYRLVYDSRGYINDVENVGTGAISENQLVLVRKQGTNNQLSLRIKETFILYEYDDIEESRTLRELYSKLYPDGWRNEATIEEVYGYEDEEYFDYE